MTAEPQDETTFRWPAAMGRLAIGLVQGIALYLLIRAREDHGWPATEKPLFAALLDVDRGGVPSVPGPAAAGGEEGGLPDPGPAPGTRGGGPGPVGEPPQEWWTPS